MDTSPPSITLDRPYHVPDARDLPVHAVGSALRLLAALATCCVLTFRGLSGQFSGNKLPNGPNLSTNCLLLKNISIFKGNREDGSMRNSLPALFRAQRCSSGKAAEIAELSKVE